MKIVDLVIILHIGIAFILDDQTATASYHSAIYSYEGFKDNNHFIGRKSGKIHSIFTHMDMIDIVKVSFVCSFNNNLLTISNL